MNEKQEQKIHKLRIYVYVIIIATALLGLRYWTKDSYKDEVKEYLLSLKTSSNVEYEKVSYSFNPYPVLNINEINIGNNLRSSIAKVKFVPWLFLINSLKISSIEFANLELSFDLKYHEMFQKNFADILKVIYTLPDFTVIDSLVVKFLNLEIKFDFLSKVDNVLRFSLGEEKFILKLMDDEILIQTSSKDKLSIKFDSSIIASSIVENSIDLNISSKLKKATKSSSPPSLPKESENELNAEQVVKTILNESNQNKVLEEKDQKLAEKNQKTNVLEHKNTNFGQLVFELMLIDKISEDTKVTIQSNFGIDKVGALSFSDLNIVSDKISGSGSLTTGERGTCDLRFDKLDLNLIYKNLNPLYFEFLFPYIEKYQVLAKTVILDDVEIQNLEAHLTRDMSENLDNRKLNFKISEGVMNQVYRIKANGNFFVKEDWKLYCNVNLSRSKSLYEDYLLSQNSSAQNLQNSSDLSSETIYLNNSSFDPLVSSENPNIRETDVITSKASNLNPKANKSTNNSSLNNAQFGVRDFLDDFLSESDKSFAGIFLKFMNKNNLEIQGVITANSSKILLNQLKVFIGNEHISEDSIGKMFANKNYSTTHFNKNYPKNLRYKIKKYTENLDPASVTKDQRAEKFSVDSNLNSDAQSASAKIKKTLGVEEDIEKNNEFSRLNNRPKNNNSEDLSIVMSGEIAYLSIGNNYKKKIYLKISEMNVGENLYSKICEDFSGVSAHKFFRSLTKFMNTRYEIDINNLHLGENRSFDSVKASVELYKDLLYFNNVFISDRKNFILFNLLANLESVPNSIMLNINDGNVEEKINHLFLESLAKSVSNFDNLVKINFQNFAYKDLILSDVIGYLTFKKDKIEVKKLSFKRNKWLNNFGGFTSFDLNTFNFDFHIKDFDGFRPFHVFKGNLDVKGKMSSYGNNIDERFYNFRSTGKVESNNFLVSGLDLDSVITALNRQEIKNVADLKNSLYKDPKKSLEARFYSEFVIDRGKVQLKNTQLATNYSSGIVDAVYDMYSGIYNMNFLVRYPLRDQNYRAVNNTMKIELNNKNGSKDTVIEFYNRSTE